MDIKGFASHPGVVSQVKIVEIFLFLHVSKVRIRQ